MTEATSRLQPTTIPAVFLVNAAKRSELKAFMHRGSDGWHDVTWKEAVGFIEAVASYLISAGIKPGDKISIFSENRPEWVYADIATLAIGAADVTIYATNSSQEAAYIVNDSDSRICFCSGKAQVDRLLQAKATMPALEKVIVFNDIDLPDPLFVSMKEVIAKGAASPKTDEIYDRCAAIKGDDLMTLIYTSGTTGNPKGVMLTHSNMIEQVKQFLEHHPFPFDVIALSLLPVSHSLERSVGYHAMIIEGGVLAYSRGPEFLLQDLQEIRPTAFLVVPRVLEKIHEGIMTNLGKAPDSKQKIFRWCERVARKAVPYIVANRPLPFFLRKKYALAEKMVFSKVRAAIGLDRIRVVGVGGAPISPFINAFFQGFGIEVHLGFGLTETSPVTHVHTYKDRMPIKLETSGPILPRTQAKINDDGELLIKGPQVMKGYYKKPAETAEVFTEDGWFRTGDIGFIDADGYLTITDRKKDIIITAGGKNVAPQVIENRFKNELFIEQMAVIGDRRKFLVALIVPGFDAVRDWAGRNGIEAQNPSEIAAHPGVIAKFAEIIDAVNEEFGRVEQIKNFRLLDHPFSQETGELTPTLKVKRRVIEQKYHDIIETMYEEN